MLIVMSDIQAKLNSHQSSLKFQGCNDALPTPSQKQTGPQAPTKEEDPRPENCLGADTGRGQNRMNPAMIGPIEDR